MGYNCEAKKKPYVCKHCGQTFQSHRPKTFCSDNCLSEHLAGKYKEKSFIYFKTTFISSEN